MGCIGTKSIPPDGTDADATTDRTANEAADETTTAANEATNETTINVDSATDHYADSYHDFHTRNHSADIDCHRNPDRIDCHG